MHLLLGIAFANPAMNGTWTLDRAASEPVAPILRAQGLTWLERTLAEAGSPTHTIEWRPEHAVVHVQSGWYERVDDLPLDGVARRSTVARVGEVNVASEMVDGVLVTRAELTLRDGAPAVLESHRELVDADTLRLTMRFARQDSTSPEWLTAERIFLRQP
ncbi:MAG: hypothetical protein R3F61_35025 [Myxococcota bacterium]